jgi:hypothetical protein
MRQKKLGMFFSKEHRKKLSIARKKRITKQSTIEKLKKSMIGKNVGKYIKIYEFEINGKLYQTKEGICKFSKKNKMSVNTLKKIINGKTQYNNWKYIRKIN